MVVRTSVERGEEIHACRWARGGPLAQGILDFAALRPCVDAQDLNPALIIQLAYPVDRVVVINWAAAAGRHREWFGPDNIHPDAVGRRAYTGLIDSAVDQHGL